MRIFYDIDTQNDFMNKNGALYVPDAESIKTNLKLLTDFARKNKIPILGSVDRHFGTEEYREREQELQRNGGPFPDHCMDGTFGQEKIKETILLGGGSMGYSYPVDRGIYIQHRLDNKIEKLKIVKAVGEILPEAHVLDKFGLFFEKQHYDVFTNPTVEFSLDIAEVDKAVVYGVATDYCVKAAVLGMQKRRIQCYVVKDAIKGVAPETTQQALEEIVTAGAKFVITQDVLEGRI